ncbi:MAG: gliding motility-associated C-terminal domain-containing protein [Chitinophagales bacterium]|nr:gliding motility-associated C-terminal domain-containing protein [Chitinophagaceae bacterium]MCB9065983.1 gliding motility-associated C-terminal domain-containing protein [Chitinophagales bacterium]
MKQNLIPLFAIMAICFGSHMASGQLTTGIVAHWDFSNNANDISGNGNHGTGNNITYTTGKQGNANTAVRFTGNNSYITVPYKSNLNVTQFSICALVKVEGYYTGACQTSAILWRGSQWQNGYYSLIYFDNPYTISCSSRDTSKNVFAGQIANLIATPSPTQWQYTPTIVSQRWYCVITTFDGTYSKIYVDGALKSTYTVSAGSIGSSTEGLGIGANRFGGSSSYPYWMTGVVDDLRIYNRVLSSQDISAYCNLFPSANTPKVFIPQPLSPEQFCAEETINVPYDVTQPFYPGNIFSAELSDAAGSFTSPVVIGSVMATGAGVINCTIPKGTPPGNMYRIRVTASSPVDISADNGVNLTVKPTPTLNASSNAPVCIGDSLLLNATYSPTGTIIDWNGPGGYNASGDTVVKHNIDYVDSGNYIAKANYNGCIVYDTVNVFVGNLKFDLGNDTTICGDSIVLDPGITQAQYLWQDGSTGNTYVAKKTGRFTVIGTLGTCTHSDTIDIDVLNLNATLPNDTFICPGDKITISIEDTFDTYKWNIVGVGSTPSVILNTAGTYWVEVTKSNCTDVDSIKLSIYKPGIMLGNDTVLCNDESITLNAQSIGGSRYTWQNGSTEQTYVVRSSGTFSVTVENICGRFTDDINVAFEECHCNPIIPTAFSPNNDGLNDDIGPKFLCDPYFYKFTIANRWGQVIFSSKTKGEKWDGTYKGKPAQIGTYYYLYQVTDKKGRDYKQKGDITLLR